MAQLPLEVADIFRACGPAWRRARAGHLNLNQLKVMSAIERCRTAELGGHVMRCEHCHDVQVAYNSCRNRHCPKCQASAAQRWLEARQADLLPVEYYHVVFTLPAPISDIAYQNKAEVYGLLFKSAAETLNTIARDPRHLGARIGMTMVLHTWGSALTHHPMSIASCRAVDWLPMATAGKLVGVDSFCQSGCYRDCFGVGSSISLISQGALRSCISLAAIRH